MQDEERMARRWCPNCQFFFKDFGGNRCDLARFRETDEPAAVAWLQVHSDNTSRIREDADNCPCFIPYPELAQTLWCLEHGVTVSAKQKAWM
jgi:hypothetical protein